MNRSQLRYVAPNAVSAANIAAGFLAMASAADGRFDLAVYLLLLALTLDTLDGCVARWLSATSEFGQEVDSFSDALSFGAAPALLLYLCFFKNYGTLGHVVPLIYLMAAIFRLTRFVLISDAHSKTPRTHGVPVPIAASYVMALVLMRDQVPAAAVVAVPLIFALLMVSRVRLPNLKGRNLVTYMLLVGVINYYTVVVFPTWTTIAWWNVWNLLIILAAMAQDRRNAELSAMESDAARNP